MKVWEELDLYGIDRCAECRCVVSTDWEYMDFTNKTVAVCAQCETPIYLEDFAVGDKQ